MFQAQLILLITPVSINRLYFSSIHWSQYYLTMNGQFLAPSDGQHINKTFISRIWHLATISNGTMTFVTAPAGRLAGLYNWAASPTLGSSVCYFAIKDLKEENPQIKTTLEDILTKRHICVDRNFEQVSTNYLLYHHCSHHYLSSSTG